jgi:hypothetical protein
MTASHTKCAPDALAILMGKQRFPATEDGDLVLTETDLEYLELAVKTLCELLIEAENASFAMKN